MQVMGVYSEELVEPIARVLCNLGVKSAMVVYGGDGMDELSVSAPTTVCEVRDGTFSSYTITPEQFGIKRSLKEDLLGGTPADNAVITRAIFSGEKGARRDAVLLNSAAALYVSGRSASLTEGIGLAESIIDSGKALWQLERIISLSGQMGCQT